MSWSISHTGTPGEIAEALDRYGALLTGRCKAEFERAQPRLEALIDLNRTVDGRCKLSLDAYGSVSLDYSTDPPTETSSACYCRLTTAAPSGPAAVA